ncbi:MAG: GatB/YqeY domain-containing protein [Clostridia bacterium]|nr:GatB/YqeY domain-containing protein [Clostridia bacterium]
MEFKTLQQDMIAAMKAHDKTTKDAVSSLIAAIKKVAIDEGVRENITEEICDRVILKELKTIKEQIDTCPEARNDLREAYQATYDIIAKYAPKMLSADEVKEIILRDFAEVVASKNKGMIMKNVMGALKGKAEGSVINAVVASLCE